MTGAVPGVVRLRYAHLCLGIEEDLIFVTLKNVMMRVVLPAQGPGRFPPGSMLVSSFVAHGGAAGQRELSVAFTDNQLSIINGTVVPLNFRVNEPGYPALAHSATDLEQMSILGPGIFYFDFVVDNVHVGRLPILAVPHAGPPPAGQVQPARGAGQGIVLDWGHLMDRFEQHPDGTLSMFHVYEVWPVLTDPAQPFGMDSKMLLQVSAPTTFIGDHRLSIVARDADGNRIGDVDGNIPLAEVLPGRALGWLWTDLRSLGFPSAGDYVLDIMVDGQRVGGVDVFARAARFEADPGKDRPR